MNRTDDLAARWLRHAAALAAALVLGGCAPTRPVATQAPTALPNASDQHQRLSDELLMALQAGDYAKIVGLFGPHMKTVLPECKLADAWRPLTTSFGELRSWSFAGRDNPTGKDRLRYELTHERGQMEATIVFDGGSNDIVGLFFHRKNHARTAPPAPVSDPAVHGAEVQVGSGSNALPAYLTTPVAPPRAGAFPAVVLVPGSGPQDMDETLGAAKPFRDLAIGLSRRGIAVLRFDKRTFANAAYFEKEQATIDNEEIDDSLAAVRRLRDTPGVDPRHICIVGHSLGALVAPEIAYRSGAAISCVVMLAAPGRSLPELLVDQMKRRKAPSAETADLEAQMKRLLSGKLNPEDNFAGVNVHYWMSLLTRDEVGIAKRLAKPIFLLRGESDQQVTEIDQRIWEQALAGVPNVRSVTLPGLNHFFMHESPTAADADPQKLHVDDAAISLIASFVLADVPN